MRLFGASGRWCLASLAGLIWLAATGLSVRAQDDALDDFEARYLEAVKRIEAQLIQAGQQIEAEQQALLDKLGKTHDELQAERERADRLASRLRALSGEASVAVDVAEPVSMEAVVGDDELRFLDHPEREVDALGMIRANKQVIGTVPAGTESMVLIWPDGLEAGEGLLRPDVRNEGGRGHLEIRRPMGSPLLLAQWWVEGTDFVWSWRAHSPIQSAEALAYLDRLLPRSRFEARRAGITLAGYQFRPVELDMDSADGASAAGVVLRPGLGPIRLGAEPAGYGWLLVSEDATHIEWVSLERSWQVTLGRDGRSVRVRESSGIERRIQELERQKDRWQRDAANGGGTGGMANRVRAEIERIDEQLQRLEAVRDRLSENRMGEAAIPVVRLMSQDEKTVLGRLPLAEGTP
ncbi:hypothetical protein [Mucisphaera sp.]|uniref:hypothetical protein n=1 Tax=Mucisphaera sp. TaxID=2913024 RepID=UPI003D11CA13